MAFGYYKTVTIDHTQCGGSDSTDFPCVIWVTDNDLRGVGSGGFVQNVNGYDIRPYADSGASTPLTFDLAPGVYASATGRLEMWVKIPTVSHTTDTVFYLFFGDSGITTDGSSSSTWVSNYHGVWHMEEGTGQTAADSTANSNALTLRGTLNVVHWTTAEIFNGIDDHTADANYQDGTSTFLPVANGDWTASGWVKGAYSGSNSGLLGQWIGGSGWILFKGVNDVIGIQNDGTFLSISGAYPNDANWHHVAGQKSSSTGLVYVDGALIGSGSVGSSTLTNGSTPLNQNNYANGGGSVMAAQYDEWHFTRAALSADWILQEYNNQVSGSTFLTFGALTPVGGVTFVSRLALLGVG